MRGITGVAIIAGGMALAGPVIASDALEPEIQESVAPESAQPATSGDLYREMRIQGGQNAARNRHQVLVGDFTCDGVNDQVAGWVDRDNPEGPFFALLFVTGHKGKMQSEMKLIPFAQSEQYALCVDDETAPPVLSWQIVPTEYVADVLGDPGLCNIAVRVDDFMCDAPQFFWSNDATQDGEHWAFYRN
ncbi:hypothetical protein [Thalassospira sp.]|uniref:hypothetical protein n=1 Tax=Thalassospira sp. TaxID=1912094 RepID=UPI002732A179|nr:hypothetical protein [Thalassospira sp.]MDP2699646.1 hypothetical protein [Thalassospira sp.]